MTWRAALIGFLFAMLVAVGGHFNDVYMGQTYLVGNMLPISVVGFLALWVLVVNPILRLWRREAALRPAELAVMVALPLAACVIPGSGFLRTFTPSLMLPHHYVKMTPSWQQQEVMSYFPSHLLAQVTPENEDSVLAAFLQGMGRGGRHIGLTDIPWGAWGPALSVWLPLFLVLMIGLIGLCLVLHRQWTSHEHLVYPVAEFISTLTRAGDPDEPGSALRTRLFWGGLLPVLVIHIVNGLYAWYPNFIEIPHRINIWPVAELFPRASQTWGSWSVFSVQIYFTVLAFSYFLPSDITLSLGLTGLVRMVFATLLLTYGVTTTYGWITDGEIQGLMFGAYLAVFILIAFSGRAYYGRVFLEALGLRSRAPRPDSSAVWGARVFLVALALSVALMMRLGLAWPAAVLLTLTFVLLFTVMTRICAETGLFFIQPSWQPVGILLGLFGAPALGPRVLAIAALACVVLSIDPRECMMPFIANALRVAENVGGVGRGRLAALMALVLVVGLAAGLVTVLWLQYDRGVGLTDTWATRNVPLMPFQLVDSQVQRLKADGLLESSTSAALLERVRLLQPNRSFLAFFALGFVLFAVCAVLRLRFSKWPLHPVLFLVWYTYPLCMFGTSFLLGWLIKSLVVKFGGGRSYQRGKPMMIGMVAGDLLGGLIFMVVGAVYYAITGFPPKRFGIFPG